VGARVTDGNAVALTDRASGGGRDPEGNAVTGGGIGSEHGGASEGSGVAEGGRGPTGNMNSGFDTDCGSAIEVDIEDDGGTSGGVGDVGKGVEAGRRSTSGSSSTFMVTFESCVEILSETAVVGRPDFGWISGFDEDGFEEIVVAFEEPFEQDLLGLKALIVCWMIGTGSSG
jgi:hypothetical protein